MKRLRLVFDFLSLTIFTAALWILASVFGASLGRWHRLAEALGAVCSNGR